MQCDMCIAWKYQSLDKAKQFRKIYVAILVQNMFHEQALYKQVQIRVNYILSCCRHITFLGCGRIHKRI